MWSRNCAPRWVSRGLKTTQNMDCLLCFVRVSSVSVYLAGSLLNLSEYQSFNFSRKTLLQQLSRWISSTRIPWTLSQRLSNSISKTPRIWAVDNTTGEPRLWSVCLHGELKRAQPSKFSLTSFRTTIFPIHARKYLLPRENLSRKLARLCPV